MQTQIKVCGYHIDVCQHVNSARYLEFLEEARWEWLESSAGSQWKTEHYIAFIVGISTLAIVALRCWQCAAYYQQPPAAQWKKRHSKPGRYA